MAHTMTDQPQTPGDPATLYALAVARARECTHVTGRRDADVSLRYQGTTYYWCAPCDRDVGPLCRAAYTVAQQERAAQRAAARPCQRCGTKPHAYQYGGALLCRGCLRTTRTEHRARASQLGWVAMVATGLLVDTSAWAVPMRREG